MLWIIFIAGIAPYLANETLRSPGIGLFSIIVYISILIYYFSDITFGKYILNKSFISVVRSPHFVLYCLAMFASLAVLTFFYNDELSYYQFAKVFGYILTATLTYILLPVIIWPRMVKQLWSSLMYIGAFCGFLGILNLFTDIRSIFGVKLISYLSSPFFGIPSTAGPFYEINIYSMVLMLGTVGSFYFITKRERLRIAIFSFSICCFALFFTWSRSMYLTVPAIIWTSVFIGSDSRKKTKIVFVTTLCFAVGILLIFTVPILRMLFEVEQGLTGREIIWPAAIAAIKARPFSGFGVGIDAVLDAMTDYGGMFGGKAVTTHNGFLEIGLQMGLFSAVALLTVFIVSIVRLLRSNIDIFEKRAIGSGIVATFLAISTTAFSLHGTTYISMVLSILWGLGNLSAIRFSEVMEDGQAKPNV